MQWKTSGSRERLPQLSLSLSSVLRIDKGMRDDRATAITGVQAEAVDTYDKLLGLGSQIRTSVGSIPKPTKQVLPVDRTIDRVISGLYDIQRGLQKIFDPNGAVELTEVERDFAAQIDAFAQVSLPEGTGFLIIDTRDEWAEIAKMIERLRAPGLDLKVGPIDMTPVLERLERCQEEYTVVLKISGNKEKAVEIGTLLNQWDAELDRLDTIVAYHHPGNQALRQQIFDAFYKELQALAAARAREREAAKREEEAKKKAPIAL